MERATEGGGGEQRVEKKVRYRLDKKHGKERKILKSEDGDRRRSDEANNPQRSILRWFAAALVCA